LTNLIRCNTCENRGCPYSSKQLNTIDSRTCKHYLEPQPFKLPLLVRLVEEGQANVVNKLLGMFGLRIKETNEKPYFMLTVNG